MKQLLLIILILPAVALSQGIKKGTKSGKPVNTVVSPGIKQPEVEKTTFKKKLADSVTYTISDTVDIETGKGEKVNVFFYGIVPITQWQKFVSQNEGNDKNSLYFLAQMLTMKASYTLKNSLSFEPFKKQFFTLKDGVFECLYKMSGRNGYGNMTETSEIVSYEPEKSIR